MKEVQIEIIQSVTREIELREDVTHYRNILKRISSAAKDALNCGQTWPTADRAGVLVEGLQEIVKICEQEIEGEENEQ